MSFIPLTYCEIEAKFRAGGSGRNCSTILGARLAAPLTQGVVDDISTELSVAYKAWLHTAGAYNGCRVLEGQILDALVWESTAGNGSGTKTGAMQPPQVQCLVSKRTAVAGRAHRGRSFLPDVLESHVNDDGTLSAGAITAVQAWADGVFSACVESGALTGMVLLHAELTPVPTLVTSYAASTRVSTLRERYVR